jgi:hypothetical protein
MPMAKRSTKDIVSVTVGGRFEGALAVGNNNRQKVSVNSTLSDTDQRELRNALLEISSILRSISTPAQRSSNAALEAAIQREPDRSTVGHALQAALMTAREAAGFAETATKIAPALQVVTSWLGGSWSSLLHLI